DNLTQRAITLNVIGFNNLIENNNVRNRFIGSIWGELEIAKGLKYTLRASGDKTHIDSRYINPPSDLGWYYITTPEEAALDVTSENATRTVIDNLLSYEVEFGKHKIDALLGWIQQRDDFYRHFSRGVGFDADEISHLEYAEDTSASEYESTITAASYISRVNYIYNDRYLLTMNFRQDRSSLFSPENNTGNYFSVSGAWKIHNEPFFTLSPETSISTLKLRGGYGQLGNNTIAVYDYTTVVNPFASYVFSDGLAPGTITVDVKDPNIKWEDTESMNIAIETGFFNDRLQFTAEYFEKKSSDLLANVPIPYSSGAFPIDITTNAATIKNTGLEFTLNYNNYDNEFKYSISANLGTLKNEVLKIGDDDIPISATASRTEVGRSIGEVYVHEVEGIFQSQEDINNHAVQNGAAPGDIKFRDTENVPVLDGEGNIIDYVADGIINDDDRTFQGVSIPKFNYGLNFNASYKNW